MKEAKKRVLFDNYDAFAYRDEAIESLQENGVSSPSEQQIWDEVDEMLSLQWDFLKKTCRNSLTKLTALHGSLLELSEDGMGRALLESYSMNSMISFIARQKIVIIGPFMI